MFDDVPTLNVKQYAAFQVYEGILIYEVYVGACQVFDISEVNNDPIFLLKNSTLFKKHKTNREYAFKPS